jgi:hypothetical protein
MIVEIWLIKVWVFSIDVVITCDAQPVPLECVKVMYKRITKTDEDVDVMQLDRDVLSQFEGDLQRIRPISQTKMGEWEIGYLQK